MINDDSGQIRPVIVLLIGFAVFVACGILAVATTMILAGLGVLP